MFAGEYNKPIKIVILFEVFHNITLFLAQAADDRFSVCALRKSSADPRTTYEALCAQMESASRQEGCSN